MTLYVAIDKGGFNRWEILKILGLWPLQLVDILRSLALVLLLFIGPLFETGIVEGKWRQWFTGRTTVDVLTSSIGWRNYIVVSPLAMLDVLSMDLACPLVLSFLLAY